MAPASLVLVLVLVLLCSVVAANPSAGSSRSPELDEEAALSILTVDWTYHDYSPPSPPPPPPLNPPSCSCEGDLGGAGSLDTLCQLSSSLNLTRDIYIEGGGSLALLTGVTLACPLPGCSILVNLTGELRLGNGSAVIAGSVYVEAANMSLAEGAAVNTSSLAGDPPAQTSGVPTGINGDGGGHGGRGASCVLKEGQTPEDSWGGDAYAWSSLTKPGSHGSRGGTTSREFDYGGGGGGRIWLKVIDVLEVDGVISADGGHAGSKGGGGSGGSIYISAYKM